MTATAALTDAAANATRSIARLVVQRHQVTGAGIHHRKKSRAQGDPMNDTVKLHVSATLVPPPEFIREGAQPERFEIDATIDDLPDKLKLFVTEMLKTSCFQVGGSVAFLVQPLRTKHDLRAAVNTALAGRA
jgi:hypothetical protein